MKKGLVKRVRKNETGQLGIKSLQRFTGQNENIRQLYSKDLVYFKRISFIANIYKFIKKGTSQTLASLTSY